MFACDRCKYVILGFIVMECITKSYFLTFLNHATTMIKIMSHDPAVVIITLLCHDPCYRNHTTHEQWSTDFISWQCVLWNRSAQSRKTSQLLSKTVMDRIYRECKFYNYKTVLAQRCAYYSLCLRICASVQI